MVHVHNGGKSSDITMKSLTSFQLIERKAFLKTINFSHFTKLMIITKWRPSRDHYESRC